MGPFLGPFLDPFLDSFLDSFLGSLGAHFGHLLGAFLDPVFGPLGAHCGPWGLLGLILGPFGPVFQRAPGGYFRASKGPEKAQKSLIIASK